MAEIVKQSNTSNDVCEWKQTSTARYKTSGDCCVDVKNKIGIAVKSLEIKGFKTKGSIFRCCFWSFFFLSVETYQKAENGRVVAGNGLAGSSYESN